VAVAYPGVIPKLWHQTIQAHRREVHDAILDTAAALVARHGLRSVTMSQIAEETGIGRATLYKYFSGVEAILIAWHERHVAKHLEHLRQLRDQPGEPSVRLEAVLHAYAQIAFERHRHGGELGALVHQPEHTRGPEQRLVEIVRGLLMEAREVGAVRTDVPPDELTTFSLRALEAAGAMSSKAAVQRLVTLVLDGLRSGQLAIHSDIPNRA
jgi:AcrR family transcriptional regulator